MIVIVIVECVFVFGVHSPCVIHSSRMLNVLKFNVAEKEKIATHGLLLCFSPLEID